MPYLPDMAPFEHAFGEEDRDDRLTAVGWLSAEHPYPRGEPPAGLVDALRELCVHRRVRVMRGFQVCPFCPRGDSMQPTFDGEALLGSAEIRVEGCGHRFAAPNLILHYVEAHGYLPPEPFVRAVLADYSQGR